MTMHVVDNDVMENRSIRDIASKHYTQIVIVGAKAYKDGL